MSRAAVRDNLTSVSLFPFLAVLLCTMGSLVMILVVVAKVSRDKAFERAEAEAAVAAVKQPDEKVVRQWKLVNQRLDQFEAAKVAVEQALHSDQLRLQHIEDHTRRLHEHLKSLQMAAAELNAMEEDHLDDRMQAIREVDRLQQLIEDTREQIAELEEEKEGETKTFSIIPYKGLHGTERQPIYIECFKDAVVLQPEGIRLMPKDFHPPLGAGNALASALRAAREFMVKQDPTGNQSDDLEPYPLILVHPEGIGAYYRVRAAIESWDSDFGYELIDGDWDLNFPDPNPELANIEAHAVELARRRQKMLIAAAPTAYNQRSGAMSGDTFEVEASLGSGAYAGDGTGHNVAGDEDANSYGNDGEAYNEGEFSEGPSNPLASSGDSGKHIGEDGKSGQQGAPPVAGANSDDAAHQLSADAEGPQLNPASPEGQQSLTGNSQQQSQSEAAAGASSDTRVPQDPFELPSLTTNQSAGASNNSSSSLAASDSSAGGSPIPGGGSESAGESASASVSLTGPRNSGGAGSGGGEFRGSNPADVAIRRSVQVLVRNDRIAILPEREHANDLRLTFEGGKVIHFDGDERSSARQVVAGLKEHVQNWGIAGNGFYWRPVVSLKVSSDAQERAETLVALLKGRGIEFRDATTANRLETSDESTTR